MATSSRAIKLSTADVLRMHVDPVFMDHVFARALAAARRSGAPTDVSFGPTQMQMRVDADGAIHLRYLSHANPTSRFEKLRESIVASAARRGYPLQDPSGRAIAAAIGRRKYGSKKFQSMAIAGKRKAAARRSHGNPAVPVSGPVFKLQQVVAATLNKQGLMWRGVRFYRGYDNDLKVTGLGRHVFADGRNNAAFAALGRAAAKCGYVVQVEASDGLHFYCADAACKSRVAHANPSNDAVREAARRKLSRYERIQYKDLDEGDIVAVIPRDMREGDLIGQYVILDPGLDADEESLSGEIHPEAHGDAFDVRRNGRYSLAKDGEFYLLGQTHGDQMSKIYALMHSPKLRSFRTPPRATASAPTPSIASVYRLDEARARLRPTAPPASAARRAPQVGDRIAVKHGATPFEAVVVRVNRKSMTVRDARKRTWNVPLQPASG